MFLLRESAFLDFAMYNCSINGSLLSFPHWSQLICGNIDSLCTSCMLFVFTLFLSSLSTIYQTHCYLSCFSLCGVQKHLLVLKQVAFSSRCYWFGIVFLRLLFMILLA